VGSADPIVLIFGSITDFTRFFPNEPLGTPALETPFSCIILPLSELSDFWKTNITGEIWIGKV
jgi:hypothetical protein